MPAIPPLNAEQIDKLLQSVADGFATQDQVRSPVLHDPSQAGLPFESVTFPSIDGVPLEGWLIPKPHSDKLIIANHPMGFSRAGQPTHLDPWRREWGTVADGRNAVEVNFVPDLKILHDAGYNVLTYDLRNHGLSGVAHGGLSSSGWFESRDVVASLRYVRERLDTRHMTVGLFSRCLGCNSTFAALTQYPDAFDGVRCLLGAQPVTTEVIVRHQLALAGVPTENLDDAIADLDGRIAVTTSLGFAARDNREWAKHVTLPTYLYGVHDDVLTEPSDLETMLANLSVADKELQWIRDTPARWDGYLEFQRRPEPMLAWLHTHMA